MHSQISGPSLRQVEKIKRKTKITRNIAAPAIENTDIKNSAIFDSREKKLTEAESPNELRNLSVNVDFSQSKFEPLEISSSVTFQKVKMLFVLLIFHRLNLTVIIDKILWISKR